MITFKQWKEKFDELPFNDQLSIYNTYMSEVNSDKEVYDIDTFEFGEMFSDFQQLVLAICNGDVDPLMPHFRFDVYGHMQSLTESEVNEMIDDYVEEIYENPDCWDIYIEQD